ncbi:MAG: D-tyrosyl-tRNA(Tyr) deacylase [Candidatus Omnitrophica bacterium]|nr:D-tyrosyl-tRNA(Tyr) deacylase [Candidatus Omnitrophota bacterium]
MRIVIQRVKRASVRGERDKKVSIGTGLLVLVGIGDRDTREIAERTASRLVKMRIFEDDLGKMNIALMESGGSVLSVPQFTLLADTARGNRPGFSKAADPDKAVRLWGEFNRAVKERDIHVECGFFGEHMDVELVNEGPVTFIIDE